MSKKSFFTRSLPLPPIFRKPGSDNKAAKVAKPSKEEDKPERPPRVLPKMEEVAPPQVTKGAPMTYADAVRYNKVEKWLDEASSRPDTPSTVTYFSGIEPAPPSMERSASRHRVLPSIKKTSNKPTRERVAKNKQSPLQSAARGCGASNENLAELVEAINSPRSSSARSYEQDVLSTPRHAEDTMDNMSDAQYEMVAEDDGESGPLDGDSAVLEYKPKRGSKNGANIIMDRMRTRRNLVKECLGPRSIGDTTISGDEWEGSVNNGSSIGSAYDPKHGASNDMQSGDSGNRGTGQSSEIGPGDSISQQGLAIQEYQNQENHYRIEYLRARKQRLDQQTKRSKAKGLKMDKKMDKYKKKAAYRKSYDLDHPLSRDNGSLLEESSTVTSTDTTFTTTYTADMQSTERPRLESTDVESDDGKHKPSKSKVKSKAKISAKSKTAGAKSKTTKDKQVDAPQEKSADSMQVININLTDMETMKQLMGMLKPNQSIKPAAEEPEQKSLATNGTPPESTKKTTVRIQEPVVIKSEENNDIEKQDKSVKWKPDSKTVDMIYDTKSEYQAEQEEETEAIATDDQVPQRKAKTEANVRIAQNCDQDLEDDNAVTNDQEDAKSIKASNVVESPKPDCDKNTAKEKVKPDNTRSRIPKLVKQKQNAANKTKERSTSLASPRAQQVSENDKAAATDSKNATKAKVRTRSLDNSGSDVISSKVSDIVGAALKNELGAGSKSDVMSMVMEELKGYINQKLKLDEIPKPTLSESRNPTKTVNTPKEPATDVNISAPTVKHTQSNQPEINNFRAEIAHLKQELKTKTRESNQFRKQIKEMEGNKFKLDEHPKPTLREPRNPIKTTKASKKPSTDVNKSAPTVKQTQSNLPEVNKFRAEIAHVKQELYASNREAIQLRKQIKELQSQKAMAVATGTKKGASDTKKVSEPRSKPAQKVSEPKPKHASKAVTVSKKATESRIPFSTQAMPKRKSKEHWAKVSKNMVFAGEIGAKIVKQMPLHYKNMIDTMSEDEITKCVRAVEKEGAKIMGRMIVEQMKGVPVKEPFDCMCHSCSPFASTSDTRLTIVHKETQSIDDIQDKESGIESMDEEQNDNAEPKKILKDLVDKLRSKLLGRPWNGEESQMPTDISKYISDEDLRKVKALEPFLYENIYIPAGPQNCTDCELERKVKEWKQEERAGKEAALEAAEEMAQEAETAEANAETKGSKAKSKKPPCEECRLEKLERLAREEESGRNIKVLNRDDYEIITKNVDGKIYKYLGQKKKPQKDDKDQDTPRTNRSQKPVETPKRGNTKDSKAKAKPMQSKDTTPKKNAKKPEKPKEKPKDTKTKKKENPVKREKTPHGNAVKDSFNETEAKRDLPVNQNEAESEFPYDDDEIEAKSQNNWYQNEAQPEEFPYDDDIEEDSTTWNPPRPTLTPVREENESISGRKPYVSRCLKKRAKDVDVSSEIDEMNERFSDVGSARYSARSGKLEEPSKTAKKSANGTKGKKDAKKEVGRNKKDFINREDPLKRYAKMRKHNSKFTANGIDFKSLRAQKQAEKETYANDGQYADSMQYDDDVEGYSSDINKDVENKVPKAKASPPTKKVVKKRNSKFTANGIDFSKMRKKPEVDPTHESEDLFVSYDNACYNNDADNEDESPQVTEPVPKMKKRSKIKDPKLAKILHNSKYTAGGVRVSKAKKWRPKTPEEVNDNMAVENSPENESYPEAVEISTNNESYPEVKVDENQIDLDSSANNDSGIDNSANNDSGIDNSANNDSEIDNSANNDSGIDNSANNDSEIDNSANNDSGIDNSANNDSGIDNSDSAEDSFQNGKNASGTYADDISMTPETKSLPANDNDVLSERELDSQCGEVTQSDQEVNGSDAAKFGPVDKNFDQLVNDYKFFLFWRIDLEGNFDHSTPMIDIFHQYRLDSHFYERSAEERVKIQTSNDEHKKICMDLEDYHAFRIQAFVLDHDVSEIPADMQNFRKFMQRLFPQYYAKYKKKGLFGKMSRFCEAMLNKLKNKPPADMDPWVDEPLTEGSDVDVPRRREVPTFAPQERPSCVPPLDLSDVKPDLELIGGVDTTRPEENETVHKNKSKLSADPNNPFKKKPRLARANSLRKPDVLSLESGPISDSESTNSSKQLDSNATDLPKESGRDDDSNVQENIVISQATRSSITSKLKARLQVAVQEARDSVNKTQHVTSATQSDQTKTAQEEPPQPCTVSDPCVNPEDRPLKGMSYAEMLENYGLPSSPKDGKTKAAVAAKPNVAAKQKTQAFTVDFGGDDEAPSGGSAPVVKKPFLKKKSAAQAKPAAPKAAPKAKAVEKPTPKATEQPDSKVPKSGNDPKKPALRPFNDPAKTTEKPAPPEPKSDPKNPALRPFNDPAKAIEDVFRHLETGSWDEKVTALTSLRRLVANHKGMLIDRMSDLVLVLIKEVKNLRSQVSRQAIATFGDMFAAYKKPLEPTLDLILTALLHKASDANDFIRADLETALGSMVKHHNPLRAMTALISAGAKHKNAAVRSRCAFFLVPVVFRLGADRVLSGDKMVSEKLLPVLADFLLDGNLDTRYAGMEVFNFLLPHKNFEKIMNKCVKDNVRRNMKCKLDALLNKGLGEPPSGTMSARNRKMNICLRPDPMETCRTTARSNAAPAPVSNRTTQPERREIPRNPDPKPKQAPPPQVDNANGNAHSNGVPNAIGPAPSNGMAGLCGAMTTGGMDDRIEAMERLGEMAEEEADVITGHADQIFTSLVSCIRAPRAEGAVTLQALNTLIDLGPILGHARMRNVIGIVVQAITAVMNRNKPTNRIATRALDAVMQHGDLTAILPPFCEAAKCANPRKIQDAVERISFVSTELYAAHPDLVTNNVLPALAPVLENIARQNTAIPQVAELRRSAAGLLQTLGAIMGEQFEAWIAEDELSDSNKQTLDELMQLNGERA